MSSATSIDPSTDPSPLPGRHEPSSTLAPEPIDPGLRPWQFFVLAGMLAATAAVIVATGQSPASIVVLSLTVVSASVVAVGAYRTLAPLVAPERADPPVLIASRTRVSVEREKTLALRSIKELEFDFAMGKLSRRDFDEMSGRLRARAIGLMRQLDAGDGYKTTIEQELVQRLGASGRRVVESSAAARAPASDAPEVRRAAPLSCGGCGSENDADARFCKNCGARLVA